MDGVFVSLIYMKDGLFRSIKSKVVQTSSGQCTNLVANQNYYFSRTESIITITNSNPTFTFKSSKSKYFFIYLVYGRLEIFMWMLLSVLYFVLLVWMSRIAMSVRRVITCIKANVSLNAQNILPSQESIALISIKKPYVN